MTATLDSATVAPLARPRSAVAVTAMFAVNGTVLGGYAGVLPSLRERLDLNPNHIALMLVAGGIAAIASMQIGGRLADARGARRVALTGLPILIAALVVLAAAQSFPVVVLGAMLIGFGNGAMDVGMNALGVQVEAARRRPIMSFFHAFFSVGNVVGAGLVLGLAAAFDLSAIQTIVPVLVCLSVLSLAVFGVLIRIAPEAAVVVHQVDGVRTRIPAAAYLLGLMALGFGLAEGTAVDWSSLHVTDVARVSATTGSIGLVAVSSLMTLVRLLGDRAVARFGRRSVVRVGGACAAVGYLVVTLVSGLPLLVLGWALVGFGVGLIAPQVYAVAGHLGGGRVLAVVVTFGYAAFLVGPGIIGFTVDQLGIHHAMALPALLSLGVLAAAAVLPKQDADLS